MATKVASKLVPILATGALTSLGNFGMDKILGSGNSHKYFVPYEKLHRLIMYKDALTAKQKADLLNAVKTGSGLQIGPSAKQRGGFLGTLLAGICVPLLMNMLTGKDYKTDLELKEMESKIVHTLCHINHLLFYGTWKNQSGMGIKNPNK